MRKLQIHATILLLCLFLIHNCSIHAQNRQHELLKGTTVFRFINPGEAHQYMIKLEGDQFAFFKLIQQGIDVIITTYDPDGKKIEEFDSPNGANGPEYIFIVTGKKGNYILEVSPLEEKVPPGNYQLSIEKIEPKGVTPDKQVDQLFTAWDNLETPGAAIAVVQNGRIAFKKGYGSANLEYDIPITSSTVFHIASVSKQFTVFSVLLLARDGKLSLDDDIRKYIPEVPDFGKTITLRQLAHHTSGLRDQWNLLAMAGWRLDDVITKEHIMKLVSKQKALNFNPGDEFLYCNTGFTLLAEVVARVSGKSFADFTQERIFEPLKMSNTLFYDDHEKIVKNRAYSFYNTENGYKKSVLSYANVGATSLFTTVEDLSLWAANFETPVLGDKEIIDQMNERGILNNGDTISYALGQDIGKYKGLTFISHGGADAGYRSFLGRFPDQRLSVIILSNDASFSPYGLAMKVADIYLKDNFVLEKKKEVTGNNSPESKSFISDNELLKTYCGQYELQPDVIVSISLEDNALYAEAPGLSKILLYQASATDFTVKGMNARLSFLKNDDGKVDKMKVFLNGQETLAPKIKEFDPGSVDLSGYTGDFYSPELSTTYTFALKQGKLVASHPRLSDFILIPVKPDQFSSDQWFFGQIEFVRDDKNNIKGCKVSSGRVRNLWFDKVH
jgi:CubicO group peptidase (beta-lactamase class C family)